MKLDIRHGRWQDTLAAVIDGSLHWQLPLGASMGGAVIFDAPYSKKTHESEQEDWDGKDTSGSSPRYSYLTEQDIEIFCGAWGDFPGWIVSITDSELAKPWRDAMAAEGRQTFAPVVAYIPGMTCRRQGDGPSSWCLYCMASRPRAKAFSTWGTLPGGYEGAPSREAEGGRGKPDWLLRALVRDYSRPGDLVIDPFAGWGSTLTAALGLGRLALGAEIDADAIAEAQRRCGRGVQGDMFA